LLMLFGVARHQRPDREIRRNSRRVRKRIS